MNYQKKEIKEGICLHTIKTKKFKTNLLSVFLTMPLVRENVTKEALISAVLRRGTMNKKTQEEISKELEKMYGASFDCGIEKIGDQHVMKFYLETIGEEFLPEKEDILAEAVQMILEIVLNPLVTNGEFCKEYIESEKENIKQIIQGKIDNKAKYALDRCIEEMYADKPYGLYKFGYIEDLETIDAKSLYQDYQKMIDECKIDIFVSGDIEENRVKELIEKNAMMEKLNDRQFKMTSGTELEKLNSPKEITESMQITQGKLVIGMNVGKKELEDKYVGLVYNMILGGGANSKLFQNVREKASLAYTAASNYIRQKNNILIRCGIEIQHYEKAVEIIKQQLNDIQEGNFTNEDLEKAKLNIISTIDFIPEEQDTEISYYFGQEFTDKVVSFEEYKEKINHVTKEQVIDLAGTITIHTIYFLKD